MKSFLQRSDYWRGNAIGIVCGAVFCRFVTGLGPPGSNAQTFGYVGIAIVAVLCYAFGWFMVRRAIDEKYAKEV